MIALLLELELACRPSWTRTTPSEAGQAVLDETWCDVVLFLNDQPETSSHVPDTVS